MSEQFTSQHLINRGFRLVGDVWVKGSPATVNTKRIPESPLSVSPTKSSSKRTGHIDLPLHKISLVLKGDPMPKQSVRSYANGSFKVVAGGKKVFNVFHYQPQEMDDRKKDYQTQLRAQIAPDFQMFTTRVHVRKLHYIYAPLKSFSAKTMDIIKAGGIVWKETQPDLMDNLKKLVFDSMAGIVYQNDGSVVSEDNVKKYYGLGGCIIMDLEGV